MAKKRSTITPEILTAAIEGFEAQKQRLDAQIAELRQILEKKATSIVSAIPKQTPRRKRRLSAASRRRIVAAQRKRWEEASELGGVNLRPATPFEPATRPRPKPQRTGET